MILNAREKRKQLSLKHRASLFSHLKLDLLFELLYIKVKYSNLRNPQGSSRFASRKKRESNLETF